MAGSSIKTSQVLLIEDDSRTAQAIEHTLKLEGFSTSVARRGEEGINRAKTSAFDVILLDLTLPDMSGFEVLKLLQASNVRTPVLIVSGTVDGEGKAIEYGLSGYDYLPKPFSSADLINRIHANIRRPALFHYGVLKTGQMAIDLDRKEVTVCGKSMLLKHEEFEAIALLACRIGRPTTQKQLIDHLYAHETKRLPRVKELQALVNGLIMKLRAATGCADYLTKTGKRDYVLADIPVPKDMRDPGEAKVRSNIARWFAKKGQESRKKPKKLQKGDTPLIDGPQAESSVSSSLELSLEHPLKEARRRFERQYLKSQIARFRNDVSQMAAFIGLEEGALREKLLFLEICCSDAPTESKALDEHSRPELEVKLDTSGLGDTSIDLTDIEHREAIAFFTREYLSAQFERFKRDVGSMADFIGMKRSVLHRKLWRLDIGRRGAKSNEMRRTGLKLSRASGLKIDRRSNTVTFEDEALDLHHSEIELLVNLCADVRDSQPNSALQFFLYGTINSRNALLVHDRIRMLGFALMVLTHGKLEIMWQIDGVFGPVYRLFEVEEQR